MSRLPEAITRRLKLPVIAAPMFRVSGPDLIEAICNAGVIAAFPTVNARTTEELDAWLTRLNASIGPKAAPWCANIVIREPRMPQDLKCLLRHGPELVITSVGSPAAVIPQLHDVGALVLADVATMRHAHKAIEAGVDGLVLLTAGSGGNTGWLNPFAFAREVRRIFDGPIVLAGGVTDGVVLRAVEALDCDLAYVGTRFIAASESMAADNYRQMLVDSSMDDILLTKAFTGMSANMLRPSVVAAGIDPDRLDEDATVTAAREAYGRGAKARRWVDIWSAGHSVSGVRGVEPAADIVRQLQAEYRAVA